VTAKLEELLSLRSGNHYYRRRFERIRKRVRRDSVYGMSRDKGGKGIYPIRIIKKKKREGGRRGKHGRGRSYALKGALLLQKKGSPSKDTGNLV